MTTKATEIVSLLARLAELLAEPASTEIQPPVEVPSPRRPIAGRVLLTPEEAATRLGIGRTTMFNLIKTKQVESVQIGRLRRISIAEVDAYAARLVSDTTAA